MTDYKATFEQWNDIEQWANSSSNASTDHCILELLSRVESLEEDCYEENKSYHACVEALVKRIEKLEDNSRATSNLKKVRPSLVKRVTQAMVADLSEDLYKGEARAAIREVSKWLQEQNHDVVACQLIAMLLEDEAKR